MIYDCFIFFNELDLLELRLHELASVVDYFVIVETARTHQNKPKILYYNESRERFRDFWDKIIHIVIPINDLPNTDSPRHLEKFQRDQIARGLKQCRPNDLILISDADEIPDPKAIAANRNIKQPVRFDQQFFYYYMNYRCVERKIRDEGTRMLPFHLLTTPQKVRNLRCARIGEGGWHFSYLGGVSAIVQKIESFSRRECNLEIYKNPNEISRCIREGLDIYGRNFHFEKLSIDSSFPLYLQSHIQKFQHHLI